MTCLPSHGRVACTRCYPDPNVQFDVTTRTEGDWRVTANPLAWGNANAEIVVLGFSKGQTQAGALSRAPHDEIAFKGGRRNLGKILEHVGLMPRPAGDDYAGHVSRLIADRNGRFHFGSLIRCSVERYDRREAEWTGTGAGMLDRFVATPFGQEIAGRCASQFLSKLPTRTRLLIMLGLGTNLGYVAAAAKLIRAARPGQWSMINPVAYTDGALTVVHTEHFKAQGSLIPDWLGSDTKNLVPRARLGIQAREAVAAALGLPAAAR